MSNPINTFKHIIRLKSLPICNVLPQVAGTTRWRVYSTCSALTSETKSNGKTTATREEVDDASTLDLSRMPTRSILRNLVLSTFFVSPILFRPGFAFMRKVANSNSPFWNPDTNRILRSLIKPLVYDQFCAGTNSTEIKRTRDTIKRIGFSGIILCYGKEVVVSQSNQQQIAKCQESDNDAGIEQWKEGNLETLNFVGDGDWIGMKFTGAGNRVTDALMRQQACPPQVTAAMDAICEKARSQGTRIWIDAEQQVVQAGIDDWTISLMRRYNTDGYALVYNTIQAYLKESRNKLTEQMTAARNERWTMAVKLVRGAYIGSDPREKIHDTKQDTDDSYNGIVQDLLSGSNLGVDSVNAPTVKLFLAGHNPTSISTAMDLIQSLTEQGKLKTMPEFGQLQGMADEVGCSVIQRCDKIRNTADTSAFKSPVPRIYKCLTWGTIQECLGYLVRRVVENSGGVDRMRDGRAAYAAELRRRLIGV